MGSPDSDTGDENLHTFTNMNPQLIVNLLASHE
jgi:hypothetical protein